MNNYEHAHGPHQCICPESGYTTIVDEGIPCNTLRCPGSGLPMRATQTGEYRGLYRAPTTRVADNGGETGAWLLKFVLGIGAGLGFLALIAHVASGAKIEKEE